jgi:hypothetical protein
MIVALDVFISRATALTDAPSESRCSACTHAVQCSAVQCTADIDDAVWVLGFADGTRNGLRLVLRR